MKWSFGGTQEFASIGTLAAIILSAGERTPGGRRVKVPDQTLMELGPGADAYELVQMRNDYDMTTEFHVRRKPVTVEGTVLSRRFVEPGREVVLSQA